MATLIKRRRAPRRCYFCHKWTGLIKLYPLGVDRELGKMRRACEECAERKLEGGNWTDERQGA